MVGIVNNYSVTKNKPIYHVRISKQIKGRAFSKFESQVLRAGVPGGFSRGPPVFAHLLIGLSHMS